MTTKIDDDRVLELGRRLAQEVLEPMKCTFVSKDTIIDLLGVCLIAGENLFILGPPGTAKSALIHNLAKRLEGKVFDYLLTRFTEPSELFGPFDIRKLRDGDLVTNTDGMLPEASFVFLDELLNANSAILNSLLMALNERIFRRGRETKKLPALMFVAASNHLPDDDALGALFDRFVLRVRSDNVPHEQLQEVADAGWRMDVEDQAIGPTMKMEDIKMLQQNVASVDLSAVRPTYIELVHRLRHAGINVSDRRVVKLQRLLAASAVICGRMTANASDLWILRHIWDTEDQPEILDSIVQNAMDTTQNVDDKDQHPRSQKTESPDPNSLARDLNRIEAALADSDLRNTERVYLRDRLGLLSGRCEWLESEQQRQHLEQQIQTLWDKLGESQ